MITEIAWKNIWRSKIRSLVVIIAIAIGLMAGVTAVSFMNGLLIGRLDDAIQIEISSIQLHKAEFMENSETEYLINDAENIINNIDDFPEVKAVCRRLKIESMVSSNRSAAGASIIGIEPEKEKLVSELYNKLVDSNSFYFEGIKRRPILIGQKLADKLKVHVRSKIKIDAVAITGVSTGGVFRVVGIFKTQNTGFDEMNVFIRFSDMQKMLGIEDNKVHEIAIILHDMMNTQELKLNLQNSLTKYKIDDKSLLKLRNDTISTNNYKILKALKSETIYSSDKFVELINEKIGADKYLLYQKQINEACETGINVSEWKDLSPELAMQSSWMDLILFVFVGIILMALGFGIVNTMLMVVLERVREIGMLVAIGMNRKKVFSMIIIESVLLSLVGGIVGIFAGWITVSTLHSNGVDMSMFSEGMGAIGYPSLIYPYIDLISYLEITVMVIITGILAAIYPALHAIKLNPAEAIRKE